MLPLGSFWKRFKDLIISDAPYVGTVIASSGGGSYTLQLQGGDVCAATGETGITVGAKVFVEGTKIQGLAPSLPEVTIDV